MVLGTDPNSSTRHFFFINYVHFIDYNPVYHLDSLTITYMFYIKIILNNKKINIFCTTYIFNVQSIISKQCIGISFCFFPDATCWCSAPNPETSAFHFLSNTLACGFENLHSVSFNDQ